MFFSEYEFSIAWTLRTIVMNNNNNKTEGLYKKQPHQAIVNILLYIRLLQTYPLPTDNIFSFLHSTG